MAKHLRPFGKRLENKRWRKTGKSNVISEFDLLQRGKNRTRGKKVIRVKFTYKLYNGTMTSIKKYRKLRGALNAMKRPNVINLK